MTAHTGHRRLESTFRDIRFRELAPRSGRPTQARRVPCSTCHGDEKCAFEKPISWQQRLDGPARVGENIVDPAPAVVRRHLQTGAAHANVLLRLRVKRHPVRQKIDRPGIAVGGGVLRCQHQRRACHSAIAWPKQALRVIAASVQALSRLASAARVAHSAFRPSGSGRQIASSSGFSSGAR